MAHKIVVPVTPDVDVQAFVKAWDFKPKDVLFVLDGVESDCDVSQKFEGLQYVTHDDIAYDLGDNQWIISKQTSAVRSYGYLKAYESGADIIMTLDSDCFPNNEPWRDTHQKRLREKATSPCWVMTGSRPTKGMPYLNDARKLPVALNHGLWTVTPDEDALQKMVIARMDAKTEWNWKNFVVPKGMWTALCGMNLAWQRFLTPAMYFGLQGPRWPFDRYDDIWAGLFVKKVCDHINYAIASGSPAVEHRHNGNILTNFNKEATGVTANEKLWQAMDEFVLTTKYVQGKSIVPVCRELSEVFLTIYDEHGDYWQKLHEAYNLWLDLFEGKE